MTGAGGIAMQLRLTPQERVTRALLGQETDRIPFTSYENKIEYGRAERELRNDGLCIVYRKTDFFKLFAPDCIRTVTFREGSGQSERHIRIETPRGILTGVELDRGPNLPWRKKYLFSDEKDYKHLKAYLSDFQFSENYDAIVQKERIGGGDFFIRGKLGYSPLQDIMLTYMGLERFSFEWADHREEVLDLYEILWERQREQCRVAASAPLLAINICGNVTASVVSPSLFRQYHLPVYSEMCKILHDGGKLAGVHFDGITRPYADLIRESELDYIEALTPPPTCDVSVKEARELWPDKALWVNFPSSVHVDSLERIREVTRIILEEARGHNRFLLGITEDVPEDRWEVNLRAILDEVNGCCR